MHKLIAYILLTSATAFNKVLADDKLDLIPTSVVELASSTKYRYVSVFNCAHSSTTCGYERFVQEMLIKRITCTKRISEIDVEFASAYPVWKGFPETLYLTISDMGNAKSYAAKIVMGKNCEYTFSMEPLNKANAKESEADFGG
jgi:hypothetical protein